MRTFVAEFFYSSLLMREFIIADNQDISKAGMMFLLSKQKEVSLLLEADNKAELIQQLRLHPQAVIVLDYTLFNFAGADELIVLQERFKEADWITPDRIQECLDLEAEWCKVNNCDQQEGTGNERRALIYALHNFEALGLTGGILHVNGKIVAFTFGMPINHETFGVHVEKADTSIEGAYAMINYEFANRIPEQYIYINREEDLGIEGLRKAKLSYQPATILEKYMACLKEHPMNMVKW